MIRRKIDLGWPYGKTYRTLEEYMERVREDEEFFDNLLRLTRTGIVYVG